MSALSGGKTVFSVCAARPDPGAIHERANSCIIAGLAELAPGAMAEWLCSGLQIRVRRFDSGLRLQYSCGFPAGFAVFPQNRSFPAKAKNHPLFEGFFSPKNTQKRPQNEHISVPPRHDRRFTNSVFL